MQFELSPGMLIGFSYKSDKFDFTIDSYGLVVKVMEDKMMMRISDGTACYDMQTNCMHDLITDEDEILKWIKEKDLC